MLTFSTSASRVLLAGCAVMATVAQAKAETITPDDGNWRESFLGCAATSSPFYEKTLFSQASDARPIMKIGDLQAWSALDENGKPELRLTTEDGLTIIGRVIGPQGEDISGALLATVPTVRGKQAAPASAEVVSAPPGPLVAPAPVTTAAITAPAVAPAAEPATPLVTDVGPLTRALAKTTATTAPSTAPQAASPAWETAKATVPETAPKATPSTEASPTIELPPAAQTPEQLLMQTTNYAVWFSLGNANPAPNTPVVYFMADPQCPFCAEATRQLQPYIEQGKIDVRLVPMPVLGMNSFTTMMSIIQGGKPHEDFIAHEASVASSATSPVMMLEPAQFNEDLKVALYRNAMWFKKNKVGAVPFFIYRDANGVQTVRGMDGFDPVAFANALPLPKPTSVAAANTETN